MAGIAVLDLDRRESAPPPALRPSGRKGNDAFGSAKRRTAIIAFARVGRGPGRRAIDRVAAKGRRKSAPVRSSPRSGRDLVLGDLFIHGIGGGNYDRVTDTIVERFFGRAPPHFLVLSATLHLPIERRSPHRGRSPRSGRAAARVDVSSRTFSRRLTRPLRRQTTPRRRPRLPKNAVGSKRRKPAKTPNGVAAAFAASTNDCNLGSPNCVRSGNDGSTRP